MNSRAAIVVATSIFAATVIVGCADEPTNEEAVGVVEQKWSPPLTGGVCPDPAIGSTEKTEYYQAKATSAIQYLVGGKEPFTYEELNKIDACKAAFNNLTNLRNMLAGASGREKTSATATLSMATSGNVCGLSAALYALDFSWQVPSTVWDEQKSVGEQLDKCWGIGVSGFYYADPNGQENKTRRIYIDPEPTRLAKDLWGATGATAAAVYTNTGTEVTVVKWPSTWINPASPPTPGQPCSTTDLLNGNETLKILQGSGNWRRCY